MIFNLIFNTVTLGNNANEQMISCDRRNAVQNRKGKDATSIKEIWNRRQ